MLEGAEHGEEQGSEHHGRRLGHWIVERRLRFDTMSRLLRAGTLGGIATIVLAALLIAIRKVPQPQVEVLSLQNARVMEMPAIVAGGCTLVLILAWSYLLTGALHSHGALRAAGLGVYSVAMLFLSLLAVQSGDPVTFIAPAVTILLLAGLFNHTAIRWIQDRYIHAEHPERRHGHHLHGQTFALCVGVTASCHLAVLLAAGAGHLFYLVDIQISTLQFGLIPILLLTGSDFAEWGEVIGAHALDAVHGLRRPGILPALAVLGALAVAVEAVVQSGAIRALVWGVSAGIEFAVIVGLVRLIARPLEKPEVPLGGLLLASAILLVLAISTWAIGLKITLIGVLWFPVVIAATIVGSLVKRLAGVCVVIAVAGVTISIWLGPLPQGDMHGFQFLFAVWTLATIGWRAVRRRHPLVGGVVGHQLVVLVVLQVLDFAFGWYGVGENFGERLSLIAALLVLAAILWDVFMSGESVTNVEGKTLPRHSRVMLYTGYAMLTAGTICFFLAGPGTGTDFGIAHDFWEQWSIYLVGLPAALLAFALAITRPHHAEPPEPGDPIDRRVLQGPPVPEPEPQAEPGT